MVILNVCIFGVTKRMFAIKAVKSHDNICSKNLYSDLKLLISYIDISYCEISTGKRFLCGPVINSVVNTPHCVLHNILLMFVHSCSVNHCYF